MTGEFCLKYLAKLMPTMLLLPVTVELQEQSRVIMEVVDEQIRFHHERILFNNTHNAWLELH
jgi:hypothetical protein